MPKYVWMAFVYTFPLWLHYITCGYLFEGLQETRGLKKHEAVFLKRLRLFFLQQLEVFELFLFDTKYFYK